MICPLCSCEQRLLEVRLPNGDAAGGRGSSLRNWSRCFVFWTWDALKPCSDVTDARCLGVSECLLAAHRAIPDTSIAPLRNSPMTNFYEIYLLVLPEREESGTVR